MITVHHLGVSQSERIIWLMEELGLPYQLVVHQRDAATRLAPDALRGIHPLGSAPVIHDGELVLAESGAIIEYVLGRYGDGRLGVAPSAPEFPSFLYWLHYANASLMMSIATTWISEMASGGGGADPIVVGRRERLERHLQYVDDRLGSADYFAGPAFTAADIMMHFPFGTMKAFYRVDLSQRANIRAWLERISARPAYRTAMHVAGHARDPALD
jgi:glutathione S-transferase